MLCSFIRYTFCTEHLRISNTNAFRIKQRFFGILEGNQQIGNALHIHQMHTLRLLNMIWPNHVRTCRGGRRRRSSAAANARLSPQLLFRPHWIHTVPENHVIWNVHPQTQT